jgi:hypothetical protein
MRRVREKVRQSDVEMAPAVCPKIEEQVLAAMEATGCAAGSQWKR